MIPITVAETLRNAANFLEQNSVSNTYNDPKYEAKLLLAAVMGFSKTDIITRQSETMPKDSIAQLDTLLARRAEGEPIAYILGHQPFWTLDLIVSKDTLIPRSDTETLVDIALSLPISEHASVLDLGTGTGAIALALKSERPNWSVKGCDFKPSIVSLARKNAQRNDLDVEFVESNWFSSVNDERFELIVSNPPYVEPSSEYLTQGDLRFEPLSALTADEDGLADLRHIIAQAHEYLKPRGYLVLEHGHQQAKQVRALFSEYGYSSARTVTDINRLDRVTLAVFDKL